MLGGKRELHIDIIGRSRPPEGSTGPVADMYDLHMDTLETRKLYIGGAPVDAHSGQSFPTINPATGKVLCEVQVASEVDVDRAVTAAR